MKIYFTSPSHQVESIKQCNNQGLQPGLQPQEEKRWHSEDERI